MSINQYVPNICVSADQWLDYVPIVSTATNLIDLFQKHVVLSQMSQSEISQNNYYYHLQQKGAGRCCTLLLPFIGNIIIIVLDYFNRKNNDKAFMRSEAYKIRQQNEINGDLFLLPFFNSASYALKNDPEFVSQILCELNWYRRSATSIYRSQNIDSRMRQVLEGASFQLKNNPAFIRQLLINDELPHNVLFSSIGDELKENREFVLSLVSHFGNDFFIQNSLSEALLNDPVFILTSMWLTEKEDGTHFRNQIKNLASTTLQRSSLFLHLHKKLYEETYIEDPAAKQAYRTLIEELKLRFNNIRLSDRKKVIASIISETVKSFPRQFV